MASCHSPAFVCVFFGSSLVKGSIFLLADLCILATSSLWLRRGLGLGTTGCTLLLHAQLRFLCCNLLGLLTQLWLLRLFLLDVVQSHAHNRLLKLLHLAGSLFCLLVGFALF